MIDIVLVLIIAIIFNVLGFVWYGPLFGKKWGNIIGMPPASQMTPEANKEFQKRMIPVYILNFVLSVVTAVVMVRFTGAGHSGVFIVLFMIWLGFIMPLEAGAAMWSGKPRAVAWEMFWLSAGFQFVVFALAGVVLSIW